MFDKKIYVETFSTLHASKDTLAEIHKITKQHPQKVKPLLRPAFILSIVLVLMISSAALAAGSRILYGGWVHYASLRDAEKMGFHYPEQLGEYRFVKNSPSRIHTAPREASWLTAWLKPDYTWMSLDYEDERSQSLSVSFGKMDNPLWAYCFDYDETSGAWLGAENPKDFSLAFADGRSYIENVKEYEYEGITIYLADRVTEDFSENDAVEDIDMAKTAEKNTSLTQTTAENACLRQAAARRKTEVEAHWADSKIGLCFSISSKTNPAWDENAHSTTGVQSMTQEELLKYVKSVIDNNR